MASKRVNKVVLAYSGGLDTSIILKWLQTTYGCEVVTFTADLGQGEELEPARQKALLLGIKPENIFIEDLRDEFVRDYVFPMFRANAQYEGLYLLGTSIARPLIAKKQIEIAEQRRRRRRRPRRHRQGQRPGPLRARLLRPEARRDRHRALARMGPALPRAAHRVRRGRTRSRSPRTSAARRRSRSTPTSCTPPPRARCWKTRTSRSRTTSISRTIDPESAPDKATVITIDFEKGDPVAIDGKKLGPADLLAKLNELGRAQRHRPPRPRREPLRRHEEPRHVRDPRRHDPGARPSRHRIDHPRPRRGSPQGRADAEIRRADL